MSSLLKACKNRTVTRSLIFLTERKIAIQKPPEGEPSWLTFRRFLDRHKVQRVTGCNSKYLYFP